jgi:tRNA G18 (ribose-2'-O)-methylase SpoU
MTEPTIVAAILFLAGMIPFLAVIIAVIDAQFEDMDECASSVKSQPSPTLTSLNASPIDSPTDSPTDSPKSTDRLKAIKYNVHTHFQTKTPDQLREIATKLALPVHLMLFNLDGNMNIAMSIRTAAVLGCSDVWIVGRRKYDARPEVGARNYIRIHKIDSLGENPAAFFEAHNLAPVLVEQGGTALEEMNFKPLVRSAPVCFVMGSESHGLPKQFLAAMSTTPRVSISQYGLVRSLNVSIAASIVMYEYVRQWRGMRLVA